MRPYTAFWPTQQQTSLCDSFLLLIQEAYGQYWAAGSLGKTKTDGESQDEVPFMAQEERRPLTRARKTMQLHDVDSKLRDMRWAAHNWLRTT